MVAKSSDSAPGRYPKGKHPNSLAALAVNRHRPWQKGSSGNPEGRPNSGPIITPHLRRFANFSVADFYRLPIYDLTMAEAIAAGMWTLAIQQGGSKEREQLLDRCDGGVTKPIDMEVNPGSGWLTLQEKLKSLSAEPQG